eukprot:TRINITY_DN21786_c0_g1_i1.p1 TRINITY_DN21786_c0_g1~~TRINITY_DN21786_c0_g1_i1.p1  ORF type:complete len:457 (-),score=74.27 TRINITY_DN21786_c0_g1_i1:137-1462(-)
MDAAVTLQRTRSQKRSLLPGRTEPIRFEVELICIASVSIYLTIWALVFRHLSYGTSTRDLSLADGEQLDHWSFLESFYFGMVTLTTVGYGNYAPADTTCSRMLGMLFIWCNVVVTSSLVAVLGGCVQREVERLASATICTSSSSSRKVLMLQHFSSLMAVVLLLAVLYHKLEEDKSLLDGFYFATVTLSTVGYGREAPSHDLMKVVMIPMLLFGVALVGNMASSLAENFKAFFESTALARRHRIAISFPTLLAASLGGGLVFRSLGEEAWSLHECLYFGAMTITTVGYGDYAPVSTREQKVFAIIFIWLSVTMLTVLLMFIGEVGEFSRLTLRKHLRSALLQRLLDAGVPMGGVVLFGILHILGMLTFSCLESWNLTDSLYFTTVTLSTVGYGDIVPMTESGRKMAVGFALVGVPCFASVVSALSAAMTGHLVQKLELADD